MLLPGAAVAKAGLRCTEALAFMDKSAADPLAVACGLAQIYLKNEDAINSMIDATIQQEPVLLILVADGHGGSSAAEHVAGNMLQSILANAASADADGLDGAVRGAFRSMHDELRAAITREKERQERKRVHTRRVSNRRC